jgi:thiamine kinase-like enzyme
MDYSNKQLTVQIALQLVSEFFETEWPQTKESEASLREVTGGFVNTLHLLSRKNAAKKEPASVLIRHFGRTNDIEDPPPGTTTLSATEQAVVYYEMGRIGWGPKLYGIFPGGRLEEYIDAHPLTAEESMDPKIRHDIARSYARLHSLQLPIRKQNFKQAVLELKGNMANKDALAEELSKGGSQKARDFAEIVRTTDWSDELDWVSNLFITHECKQTIAIGDANYLNVLVKNYDSECRAMLIDYETATHSYRGIDIGGHFTERMYCWGNPTTNLTGYSSADFDEQRLFCTSYLQEMQSLGQGLTANDSLAHLMVEVQVGRLYQILFSVCMSFQQGIPDGLPRMVELMAGLAHMMDTYFELKRQFWERQTPS